MQNEAVRAVHFVGSFPAATPEEAMRAMLSAEVLHTLPTGETHRYEYYIQPVIEDLVRQGALEVKRQGTWQSSRQRTIHRPARGTRLTADRMDLGYLREAESVLPLFHELRGDREFALQIGMPTDFTLAFIAVGPGGLRANRAAFTAATVREITAIRELAGDDVVIQLEATAELVLAARLQPAHRRADAVLGLSRGIAALAAAAPDGTRFGVHLCLGSLHNRARARLHDTRPLVDLANAVVRHWPDGRPLEFVHGPLAAGDIPPPTGAAFYGPLRDLVPGPRFHAGFVHDTPSAAEQEETLHTVERALGRRVDGVASACGLGRVPRDMADRLVTRAVALAAAP
ncbi:hypothetical protein [Nocardia jiangsuensis]|uniref:Cobalamin-independent methionine synthase catalytic subunit n=1 Tax=Nocardia jiangsuensis TaxID=1691563 RepID=A0ABV8DNQ9_9NOCA